MNTIAWWLLQNSITVVVALPVVWLLARIRSQRPAEQHVLWLLLLIKLVTPPLIVWPVSVEELSEWMHSQAAVVSAPGSDGEVDEVAGADEWPVVEETFVADAGTSPLAISESLPIATIDEPPARAIGVETISFEQAALAAWLIGAVILGAVMARQVARHWWLMRRSRGGSPELNRLVKRVASRLNVPPVAVRVSDAVTSPCVSCLGRTRLIWPASLPDTDDGLEAVVAHELAHVLRRDHWVAWLELVATLAWWWNPLLWFIRFKLHETRELACDALSLELHSGDRRQYAELLLRLSQIMPNALSPVSPVRAGFGLVSRHSLRRRLQMVFQDRVSGRMSLAGIALAVVVASAALPSWAWSQTEPPKLPDAPTSDPVAAEPSKPAATPALPKVDPAAPTSAGATDGPTTKTDPVTPKSANTPGEPNTSTLPGATPAARRVKRSKAALADYLVVPGSGARVVVGLEDGDMIQEIPLGSDFKAKVQIRRLKDGTIVVEVEEDGRKAQSVLSIGQAQTAPNYTRSTVTASKSADGKTLVWEDDTERRVIDAESGKVISVERKVKTETKPVLPGEQRKPPAGLFGSTGGGLTGTTATTGTSTIFGGGTGTNTIAGRGTRTGGSYGVAGATLPNPNVGPGFTPMTANPMVATWVSAPASPFDIELAEIKVQEKSLELEAAREEAAAVKDSKSQRNVKLAELALRRAEVELLRLKGGASKRSSTTTPAPHP